MTLVQKMDLALLTFSMLPISMIVCGVAMLLFPCLRRPPTD